MKIDIFNHFMPKVYLDRLADLIPGHAALTAFPRLKTLVDVDARLRLIDEFDGLQHVLSLANPPLELVGPPDVTPDLARIANDALADLCARYPDHFPAFIAALPTNNIDASLAEIDRAVAGLGARGIQIFTNVAGKPLSAPQFRPIFRRMAQLDLPVWVHPMRGPQFADYAGEQTSEDEIMARLIYSGLLDEFPELKIITHHMGGMIPYFAGKITLGFRQIFHGTSQRNPIAEERGLRKPPIDYFKMLYADTALNGVEAATRCGHAFFGTAKCLFATDAPFDPEGGRSLIRGTIRAIETLELGTVQCTNIFAENARRLLNLPGAMSERSGLDR
jgi:uncharacterized protein